MTALLELRNYAASGLLADSRLVALKANITVHSGDLTTDDLKKIGAANRTPAVIVGLSDVRLNSIMGGEIVVEALFRIILIERKQGAVDEASRCLNLVDATIRALRSKFWGSPPLSLSAPKNFQAQSRHADILTTSGMAMWELSFVQTVALKEDDPNGLLVDLQKIGITWDLQNPTPDGLADAVDLLEDMDEPLI